MDLITIVLIILSVFGIYIGLQIALATNTPFVVVASGSMSPALEVGDLVIVQGVSASEIRVGDIVVFESENSELNIHRVNKTQTSDGSLLFITKGDANSNVDSSPVLADQIRGRVIFRIPYIGYVAAEPIIPIIIIFIVVAIIVLWPEKKKRFRR